MSKMEINKIPIVYCPCLELCTYVYVKCPSQPLDQLSTTTFHTEVLLYNSSPTDVNTWKGEKKSAYSPANSLLLLKPRVRCES